MSDTALRTVTLTIEMLTDFLSGQQPDTQLLVLSFITSNFAINNILDPSTHDEQADSLDCLNKIGELMDTYSNLKIRLLWLPRKIPFVGFKRAKQLALEAVHTMPLMPNSEPHTIKNQTKKTKETAIASWAERWHQLPHTSLAYQTVLTKPPDGRHHPTFQKRQNPVKFSRKTICTFYRIITSHAFVGSYMQQGKNLS